MRSFTKTQKYPVLGFSPQKIKNLQTIINGSLNMYVLDGAGIKISHEGEIVITVTMKETEPETLSEKIKLFFTKHNIAFEVRLVLQKTEEPDSDFAERVNLGTHRYSVLYHRGYGELVERHDLSVPSIEDGPDLRLAILLFKRRLDAEQTLSRVSLTQSVSTMTDIKY